MFKHILIPTDGSAASNNAIQEGVLFAKAIGAAVTGLHALSEYTLFPFQAEMMVDTEADIAEARIAQARTYLAEIERAAKEAGVPCDTLYVSSSYPYDAIIQAAQDKGCDLIVMASHGMKGVKGLLLGGQTQKVLTHSSIPVLVYR